MTSPCQNVLSPSMPGVRVLYLRDARALYTADAESGSGLAYATPGSAGLDLRACFDAAEVTVLPGERFMVPSGVAVEPLVQGMAGFVYSRSGLGARMGLTVSQGVGVIDPDYRGEIIVSLLNTSREPRRLRRGERMAQLVFQLFCRVALEEVASLGETDRGAGGFGHTGRI